jgi:hypothetical protein
MSNFKCINCNKEFTRKYNYEYHISNKKIPCSSSLGLGNPKHTETIPKHTETIPKHTIISPYNTDNQFKSINDIILDDIEKISNINNTCKDNHNNTCMYCNVSFVQKSSLNRHLKDRCKSKKYFDELETIKMKFDNIINKYDMLAEENEKLKKEMEQIKYTNTSQIINNKNNNTKTINNLKNNQINNGTINNNNNTVNVQLVQFGSENIDELDMNEALSIYLKSTGGNILSNMLKYVNLNNKYPQNNNICMSDLSRELVKIFNGEKFVVKKFKNAKGDILCKVINNTHRIVDKIENDDKIKKTPDMKNKIKINNVTLQLIDGCPAEDIVREEIREKEKLLNDNNVLLIKNNKEDDKGKNEERDFNLQEQIRIEHLEDKRDGLVEITLERLKEELYNGK